MKPCGTLAAYRRGCRCDACKGANSAYQGTLRSKREAPNHGTRSGYFNYGCRCDPCKQAGAQGNADQHSKHGPRWNASRGPATEAQLAVARQRFTESQAETLQQARNHYKQWTGPELELAARDDLTAKQVALMLGRSVSAVGNIRRKLANDPRKINAAGISRIENS